MTETKKPEIRTALAEYEETHGGLPLAAAPVAEAVTGLAVKVTGGTVPADQVDVLRRTICARFNDNQLLLFLTICHRRGVDPFTEAYGFPQADGGLAFGLKIDGMRALAMRTGKFMSRKVELIPTPNKPGEFIGARATIERDGMKAPVIEEAMMAEYFRKGEKFPSMWERLPETMIRKVAESKALRAAFPDALAGIYEPSEIE